MTDDPRSFNVPDIQSLRPEDLDSLGRALLALSMEVGVISDRLMILEDALQAHGIDAAALVDTHTPGEAARERIEAANHRIIRNVLAALSEQEQ